MPYENSYSGAITITPPLTRSQINDPRIARRTDVKLRIIEQKTESDDGEAFTVRPVADAIVPLEKDYSGDHLEDDIQLIIDTFSEHEFAGFIEAKWDPGFGEPPSRFIIKDGRVMRIDAQYRWPGIWPDEQDKRDGDGAVAEMLVRLKAWLTGRQANVHSEISTTNVIAEPRDRSTAAWAIAESDVRAVVAILDAQSTKADGDDG